MLFSKAAQAAVASAFVGSLNKGSARTVAAESDGPKSPPEAIAYPIAVFTKVFKTHSFLELSDAIAEIGSEGVEMTVRSGGQIEPERAEQLIPDVVSALSKNDKRLLIAATGITEVSKSSEKLLTVLRDNEVRYYRMGYYKYTKSSDSVSMLQQARNAGSKAKELAALNRELGVVGLYQNHFGNDYVGSLLWDLTILMEGIDRQHMGVAFDLRHLRAELSGSFQAAIDAVRPHLRSVYLKDTIRQGKRGESLEDVPLGEGLVSRDLFREALLAIQPAPISLHVEYFGQDPIPIEKIGPVIQAYRHDLATLRNWMAS